MCNGLVSKIIPFSSVDGPGNRTAIFLQGCNFNCLYCHNPETINACNNCGACVKECPYGALTVNNGEVIWNKDICSQCDLCLKACNRNSKPKAIQMSVDEVLNEIRKVRSFISGITVSGGECTLQPEFLVALFKEIKKMGLTAFVDTNGFIPFSQLEELVDIIDMAMVDVKSFDPDEHRMLTGKDNSTVLENIRYLSSLNKLYEVRTVIVPEILDNHYNVAEISKLIASLDSNIRYKIIKYRPLGVRTELINSYVPSDEMMNELYEIASKNGCKNIVVV